MDKGVNRIGDVIPSQAAVRTLGKILYTSKCLVTSSAGLAIGTGLRNVRRRARPFVVPTGTFSFVGDLPSKRLSVDVGDKGVIVGAKGVGGRFGALSTTLFTCAGDVSARTRPTGVSTLGLGGTVSRILCTITAGKGGRRVAKVFLRYGNNGLGFMKLSKRQVT